MHHRWIIDMINCQQHPSSHMFCLIGTYGSRPFPVACCSQRCVRGVRCRGSESLLRLSGRLLLQPLPPAEPVACAPFSLPALHGRLPPATGETPSGDPRTPPRRPDPARPAADGRPLLGDGASLSGLLPTSAGSAAPVPTLRLAALLPAVPAQRPALRRV